MRCLGFCVGLCGLSEFGWRFWKILIGFPSNCKCNWNENNSNECCESHQRYRTWLFGFVFGPLSVWDFLRVLNPSPRWYSLSLSLSLSQLLLLLCLKNQARWPQEEDNEYHRVWGYHWSLEIWAMLGFDLGDRDREEKEMARFNFGLWK